MTWVRTEDSMPLHPKILRLSDGAFRLWENGLHFANRATTDGRIDKALIPSLNHHGRWTVKQITGFVSELVPGLWTDCGDHYQIHDYEDHQAEAMSERVNRKREIERLKKRGQRDKREREELARLTGVPANVPTDVPGGQTGGQPQGQPRDTPRETSVPTRPDPSRSSLRSDGARADSPAYDPALGVPAPKPPADDLPTPAVVRQVIGIFETEWSAVMGSPLGLVPNRETQRAIDLMRWATAARPGAPLEAITEAARAACADEGFRRLGGPWGAFCASPGRHLATGKPRASGADADLAARQKAAVDRCELAKSQGRFDDAAKAKAEADAIAAERRRLRAKGGTHAAA